MSRAKLAEFQKERFLLDVCEAAEAIGAPVDKAVTRRVLDTYQENFRMGTTLWKTTDRPGDSLSYRFFSRLKVDTVAQAVSAGLLTPDNPLIRYVGDWTRRYDAAVQSCDFHADSGLAKTWIYLGGLRPVEEVLAASPLSRLAGPFARLGFSWVRFIAVDWGRDTANVYFRVRGPLTPTHFARITGLIGAPTPDTDLVDEMIHYIPKDYCVAVTVGWSTLTLERAAFYALKIPRESLPSIPERIKTFFDASPSYDPEECCVVGWSFGGDGNYIKAEHSCVGAMTDFLGDWNCLFYGRNGRDRELTTRSEE